ncbi:hypothetical protein ACNO5E_17025, partial [Vibrio parahaemolyticus]
MAKNKTHFRAGRTLDALYENVEILTGQRGKDFKAVTAKEVSALKGTVNTIVRASNSSSGSNEVVEQPHEPINVQGFGGFSSVLLTWDNPTFKGFAYAEVWRSETNNLSLAALIGTTPATVFSDVVNLGAGWYYWVRFVNKNNVPGPHQGASGVYVETSRDIGDIIDELSEQLANSPLFLALQSDVDSNRNTFEQADLALQAGIDATNTALAQAKSDLEQADLALQASIDSTNATLTQAKSDLELANSELQAGIDSTNAALAQAKSDLEQSDLALQAGI